MTSDEGGQKGRGPSESFRLAVFAFICYKKTGHENHSKGLGFIALAPSLSRSRRVAPRAEEPERELLCLLLLLWQELPHAFVTFLNARGLPHVPSAPLEFQEGVCVQLFAQCARICIFYSRAFNL
jgi:hypothetical protein